MDNRIGNRVGGRNGCRFCDLGAATAAGLGRRRFGGGVALGGCVERGRGLGDGHLGCLGGLGGGGLAAPLGLCVGLGRRCGFGNPAILGRGLRQRRLNSGVGQARILFAIILILVAFGCGGSIAHLKARLADLLAPPATTATTTALFARLIIARFAVAGWCAGGRGSGRGGLEVSAIDLGLGLGLGLGLDHLGFIFDVVHQRCIHRNHR